MVVRGVEVGELEWCGRAVVVQQDFVGVVELVLGAQWVVVDVGGYFGEYIIYVCCEVW